MQNKELLFNKDAREAGYDCDECPYYKEDNKE